MNILGKERIVLALLDQEAGNAREWRGKVAFHLLGKLYIDISVRESWEKSIPMLCQEIRRVNSLKQ